MSSTSRAEEEILQLHRDHAGDIAVPRAGEALAAPSSHTGGRGSASSWGLNSRCGGAAGLKWGAALQWLSQDTGDFSSLPAWGLWLLLLCLEGRAGMAGCDTPGIVSLAKPWFPALWNGPKASWCGQTGDGADAGHGQGTGRPSFPAALALVQVLWPRCGGAAQECLDFAPHWPAPPGPFLPPRGQQEWKACGVFPPHRAEETQASTM